MRKGLSVAMAVAGLLLSDSALAALDLSQPEKPFWEWTLSVAISLGGALIALAGACATSFAAFAAWKAAQHSSKQSTELAEHNRWQRYLQHQEQFVSMLREIEGYVPVKFLGSTELYNELFPQNRYVDKPFNVYADRKRVADIQAGLRDLLGIMRNQIVKNPNDTSISEWLHQLTKYSISVLWIRFSETDLSTLSFNGLPSGLSEDNADDTCYSVSYVAYRLLNFGEASGKFCQYAPDEVFDGLLVDFIRRKRNAAEMRSRLGE